MTMAYLKRSRVDTDDRLELGTAAKRQRQNTDHSKYMLATEMGGTVVHAMEKFAHWTEEVSRARKFRAEVTDALADVRFQAVASLDDTTLSEICTSALEMARGLDAKIPELADLEHQLIDVADAISGVVSELGLGERRALNRKIKWYTDCADVLPEVARLYNAPCRPAMLGYDENEDLIENVFVDLFEKARGALLEANDICCGSAISERDLAQQAKCLHEGCLRLRSTTDTFVNSIRLYEDLLGKNYKKHLPRIMCGICQEDRIDASECDECDQCICTGCFSRRLEGLAADAWQDCDSVRAMTTFQCLFCKVGRYDPRLYKLLSRRAMDLHQQAVVETSQEAGRTQAQAEHTAEKRRKLASHRASGLSYKDKLYHLEREVIGDLVAPKCPECNELFYNFDGCPALSCTCGAKFCALCFEGGFEDTAEVHRHVLQCGEHVPGFQQLHMPNASWMLHVKWRQYNMCRDYLSGVDLPRPVKERLQADFPRPATSSPRVG